MNNVEQRLKLAMVAYIGGNRPAVSCAQVREALATVNIPEGEVSVHEYAPKDFLVVFAKAEHHNRVASLPSITHGGFCLFFRNWNRQAQAKHVALGTWVELVIEGIPPHACETEIVEDLLGKSCAVEEIAVETASRSDMASFKLSAWTSNLPSIPMAKTLVIPEPAIEPPSTPLAAPSARKEPNLPALQYKVLIHIAKIEELVHASNGEASRADAPGAGRGDGTGGGGGRRWISQPQPWQKGKPDRRGGHGTRSHQEGGQRQVAPNSSSWQLPLLRRAEPLVIQMTGVESESDCFASGSGNTTTEAVGLETEKAVALADKADPGPETQRSDAGKESGKQPLVEESSQIAATEDPVVQIEFQEETTPAHPYSERSAVEPGVVDETEGTVPGEGDKLGDKAAGVLADSMAAASGLELESAQELHGLICPDTLPVVGIRTQTGQELVLPPNACLNQTEELRLMIARESPQMQPVPTDRIKAFCARILKALAPPLLREIEHARRLGDEAEQCTPRRITRRSAGITPGDKPLKKASSAETVLLKALGITPANLTVNEEDLFTFRQLFDSPLCENQLRAVAAIFGKVVPPSFEQEEVCRLEIAAQ
jgi:hypothetical protein